MILGVIEKTTNDILNADKEENNMTSEIEPLTPIQDSDAVFQEENQNESQDESAVSTVPPPLKRKCRIINDNETNDQTESQTENQFKDDIVDDNKMKQKKSIAKKKLLLVKETRNTNDDRSDQSQEEEREREREEEEEEENNNSIQIVDDVISSKKKQKGLDSKQGNLEIAQKKKKKKLSKDDNDSKQEQEEDVDNSKSSKENSGKKKQKKKKGKKQKGEEDNGDEAEEENTFWDSIEDRSTLQSLDGKFGLINHGTNGKGKDETNDYDFITSIECPQKMQEMIKAACSMMEEIPFRFATVKIQGEDQTVVFIYRTIDDRYTFSGWIKCVHEKTPRKNEYFVLPSKHLSIILESCNGYEKIQLLKKGDNIIWNFFKNDDSDQCFPIRTLVIEKDNVKPFETNYRYAFEINVGELSKFLKVSKKLDAKVFKISAYEHTPARKKGDTNRPSYCTIMIDCESDITNPMRCFKFQKKNLGCEWEDARSVPLEGNEIEKARILEESNISKQKLTLMQKFNMGQFYNTLCEMKSAQIDIAFSFDAPLMIKDSSDDMVCRVYFSPTTQSQGQQ